MVENEFKNNYDYAVWFEEAQKWIGKRVRITKQPRDFDYGYVNDVISPDEGRHFSKVLVQPEGDETGLLYEFNTGEYVESPKQI